MKSFFSDLVWDIPTDKKEVFLTFDDGPVPEVTPWVLEVLQKYSAKACFFCIGDNVKKHPEIYQHIIDAGHQVANHTYNHVSGWKTKDQEYLSQIDKASEFISSNLFRPPYGRIKPSQIKALKANYRIIMWDVLSGDFDSSISPQKCIDNVIDNASKGAIIVFHDSVKSKRVLQQTLPIVLQNLSDQGFTFGSLDKALVSI